MHVHPRIESAPALPDKKWQFKQQIASVEALALGDSRYTHL